MRMGAAGHRRRECNAHEHGRRAYRHPHFPGERRTHRGGVLRNAFTEVDRPRHRPGNSSNPHHLWHRHGPSGAEDGGWQRNSVKEECATTCRRLRRDEAFLPGIVGYDETVLPQIENALLSGQDIIFLGERGQAKTRMARA